jgi:hypothetical protein
MFHFPRFPLLPYVFRQESAFCNAGVAPFGYPRIKVCLRLPGDFRRLAASFIGSVRQGIHQLLVLRNWLGTVFKVRSDDDQSVRVVRTLRTRQ